MREFLALALVVILVTSPFEFGECKFAIALSDVKEIINGDEILLPPPWYKRVSAGGVKVGIVDTGIDPNHPDLPPIDEEHFEDFTSNPKEKPYDDVGHGTHVAGIIAGTGHFQWSPFHSYFPFGCVGIADGVELYVAKALERKYDENGGIVGMGEIDYLVKAIKWLMDPYNDGNGDGNTSDAVDLINLSLGVKVEDGLSSYWGIQGGDMKGLKAIIKEATELGIVIVIAAGNHEIDEDASIKPPADMDEVLTVGVIDYNKKLCYFSNFGSKSKKPDFVAPSVIASTYPLDLDNNGIRDGYIGLGGTSMAAPVFAGAIAVLMAHNTTLREWAPNLKSITRTSSSD